MESHIHHLIYDRLKESSLRLLSIKPGFPSEPIECALVTVTSIDELPPYEALSYVWGTGDAPEPITVNGIQLGITTNLFEALKHLRPYPGWDSVIPWSKSHKLHSIRNPWRDFARHRQEHARESWASQPLIWIDALCINQTDMIERANQVKLMGKIYSSALLTRVWLGKDDSGPLNLPRPMKGPFKRLGDSLRPTFHIGQYGAVPLILSFLAQAIKNSRAGKNPLISLQPTKDMVHRNQVYGFPPPSAREWEVLHEFFKNPWFQRVWVVQEIVLPNRAVAILGDWEIEWSALGEAASWFQQNGYGLPPVLKYQLRGSNDYLPVSNVVAMWEMCAVSEHEIPLLTLLRDFRHRGASQPVDKVFATLGLAKEVKSSNNRRFNSLLEPNYTKCAMEVFRDAAKFLIIEHGDLQVLSHTGGTLAQQFLEWPSWIPDWSQPKPATEISKPTDLRVYNADGDEPLVMGIATHENNLLLQGVEVDVIKAYSDKLKSYGFGYVTYQDERDFVRAAWNLYTKRPRCAETVDRYSLGEATLAFISTLTAGLNNKSKPIEEDSRFLEEAAQWFLEHAQGEIPVATIPQRLKWSLLRRPDSGRFHEAFVQTCMDRKYFMTRSGSMGIGPESIKEGDIVVVMFGGKVPFILRPLDGKYKLVGECYIPDLMKGEAVAEWRRSGRKPDNFELC